MTDTPPDWVLLEASRRTDWSRCGYNAQELRKQYNGPNSTFRALCDMITKYEQPPVDRKELCAREAWRLYDPDTSSICSTSIRAIELWEEGFGA